MAAGKKQVSSTAKDRRSQRPTPRQRLLESARSLFTTEGIRVIGIDRVLREADVAKASLYSLFGSKDNLVIAYLKSLDKDYREEMTSYLAVYDLLDRKILTFFDQAIDGAEANEFRGSHFHNAATEFPRPDTEAEHGIIEAVRDHFQWREQTLTSLLNSMNGYPSNSQAQQLLLLLDGGLQAARISRSTEPLYRAREVAVQLLSAPPADYAI
ncbi:TetR/AcrR family transcriptional regulator [Corynebacterium sp. ES2715-CONJ3]|uniref:TetR/AcrR family transcriptional regulator n=1 Tax=Corynebacterium sp. ES2715-CONJ3 TaxID=2974028 RepID=UPI00216A5168|nr:TetR/AcrR family transcriptional regulator [Corynebacterium sp. ES2715-CONJ3]MCS4492576.1 TetR/AcrR family transcriptional regulator [Corynebacterium sp. ES2715-CONJ3]